MILDARTFLDQFGANRGIFSELASNTAADYRFDEDVTAAYGQGVYRGERFKILAGIRWENTETLVERQRTESVGVSRVTRGSEYDNVLPSVTGFYDVSDSVKLRGAYYKAVGRPNPIDLAGSESVTIAGDGIAQLSRGNPDLEAREADNFDLSLEYYFSNNQGLATVALFHKDIENEIFSFQEEEAINGVPIRVTQPRNVASAAISGIELAYTQNNLGIYVDFLEGLGVSTNFTYFDSQVDVVGANGVVLRPVDQLLQQPKTVLNAALFYNNGPFETRITYARAGAFPTTISTSASADTDRFDDPYFQLDWTARYYLTNHLQLTAEIRNFTNETKSNIQTANGGDGLRDFSLFGRTAFAGVSFTY